MSSSDSRWRTFAQNGESRYSAGWAVEVAKTVSSRLACWIGNLTISAIFRHGQSATATFRKGRLTIFHRLGVGRDRRSDGIDEKRGADRCADRRQHRAAPRQQRRDLRLYRVGDSRTPTSARQRRRWSLVARTCPLAPPAAGLSIPAAGGQASMFIGSALLIASLAPLAASRDVRELSKPAHWPTTAHSS